VREIFQHLKDRRVITRAVAYIAGAWVTLQVAEVLAGIFDWSIPFLRGLAIVLAFGLPIALILAWYHGKKGAQKLSGTELSLLAGVLLVAGGVLFFMDLEPVDDAEGLGPGENRFAGRSTKRLTADRFQESGPGWSPDGESLVYVSQRSGNADLWIRGSDGNDIQLTDDESEDTQPAWSPDGRRIAFVSSRDHGIQLDQSVFFGYSLGGGIWSVPAFGGEPERVIDGGFNPCWSSDGATLVFDAGFDGPRRIWASAADGSERHALSSDESDQAAHMRPACSPGGDWIVYERQEGSQSTASNLQLVPLAGGDPVWITNDSSRDFSPAWNGIDSIVFSSDRGGAINLWQIDIDPDTGEPESKPAQLTLGAGDDVEPAVSRDGRLVYVTLRRLQNLWRLHVDPLAWETAGEPQSLVDASWNDVAPVTSPDGDLINFASDRGGSFDLWSLDPETGGLEQLTEGEAQDLQPDWSSQGDRIVFFSDRAGNNDIWVVPATGGPVVQVTDHPADDVNAYWSPDGKRIAFMSDRGGRSEIWVMGADGGNLSQVTDIGVTGHTARWSPDGEWIIFTSIENDDRNIWAVASDGSQLRQLTSEPTQDAHALWSPDGSHFLYLAGHAILYVQSFDEGAAQVLFDPGERIDYTYLSADGTQLLFTLQRVEGDLWLID